MKQANLGLDLTTKRTRKREFLDEMNRVVPWTELVALVAPHAPEGKRGSPPFPVETMLRIHFMQQWFTLSDPAMEEALHDVPLFREFAALDNWNMRLPDESTILRFRHLLEKHALAAQMLAAVNAVLSSKGLLLKAGTQWPGRYSTVVGLSNFLVSMITLPGVSALAMRLNSLQARLKQQRLDLKAALNRIQDLATLDDLTGLANRRRARELLLTEVTRVDRAVQPFSVALLDLDHFKQLNDRFGHAGGDQILRCFSEAARASVRSVDTVARWGGEEFLILMPEADVSHAFDAIERLREHIAMLSVTSGQGDMHFTFSAGVAGHRLGQSVDDTIVRADRALYSAKAAGRNRVVLADNTNDT